MMDADEPEEPEPTPAEWRMFERQVARIVEKLDPDADVEHNVPVQGLLSKTGRQVDVLIRGAVAGHRDRLAAPPSGACPQPHC